MSYYQDKRAKLLKKTHDKYHNKRGKEKAALYYQINKKTIKERERKKYRSITDIKRNKKNKKIIGQVL